MVKKFFLSVLLTLIIIPFASAQTPDWNAVAAEVVKGNTNYEKFYSIYRWECENIAYDTDYSIHTAEGCYNNRKGVCQGYSELFCRIASAAGLKTRIISGISKDIWGNVSLAGHAWVYAYTDPANDKGILIDPTWGAGTVNGSTFTFNKHNDFWFDASPYWLIYTHFPSNSSDQFLPEPISKDLFYKLPPYEPVMNVFMIDYKNLLKRYCAGENPTLFKSYVSAIDEFQIIKMDIPLRSKLYVDETVTVKIECPSISENDILFLGSACNPDYNYGKWSKEDKWIVGVFTPHYTGSTSIGIKNKEGSYSTVVVYEVVTK